MTGVQTGDLIRRKLVPGFMEQCIEEQASAHPDATMDFPDGKRYARFLERFSPGNDVLIDAVDQRAVEIEQKGGAIGRFFVTKRRATRRRLA
jgi:hypothetical protein